MGFTGFREFILHRVYWVFRVYWAAWVYAETGFPFIEEYSLHCKRVPYMLYKACSLIKGHWRLSVQREILGFWVSGLRFRTVD